MQYTATMNKMYHVKTILGELRYCSNTTLGLWKFPVTGGLGMFTCSFQAVTQNELDANSSLGAPD